MTRPTLGRQGVGEPVGEDAFEPTLEDGRQAHPEHRGDEDQALGPRHLRLVCPNVSWLVRLEQLDDVGDALVLHPSLGHESFERVPCSVDEYALEGVAVDGPPGEVWWMNWMESCCENTGLNPMA